MTSLPDAFTSLSASVPPASNFTPAIVLMRSSSSSSSSSSEDMFVMSANVSSMALFSSGRLSVVLVGSFEDMPLSGVFLSAASVRRGDGVLTQSGRVDVLG